MLLRAARYAQATAVASAAAPRHPALCLAYRMRQRDRQDAPGEQGVCVVTVQGTMEAWRTFVNALNFKGQRSRTTPGS